MQSKPNYRWGPPIWTFFHTIVSKIDESQFSNIAPTLFDYIYKICRLLRCSICTNHAISYLKTVNFNEHIKNKQDFINMLFNFHNITNTKLNKPLYIQEQLQEYANNDLVTVYNNFLKVFNPQVIILVPYIERQHQIVNLVKELDAWIMANFT